MTGRIERAIQHLLDRHGLAVSQQVVDPVSVLMALSARVMTPDKELCLSLASKLVECREQESANPMAADYRNAEFSLGQEEADYIFDRYPGEYSKHLLQPTDFMSEREEYLEQLQAEREAAEMERKRKRKRIIIICLSCVAALAAFIVIYNLPYFAEGRAFDKVEKASQMKSSFDLGLAVDDYKQKYPDGKHIDEVLWLHVSGCNAAHATVETLNAAEYYISNSNGGVYKARCGEIYDSIWNAEIARYKIAASSKGQTDGVSFVTGMLEYMRDNKIRVISFTGIPELKLKEYAEYPENMRRLLESLPGNMENDNDDKLEPLFHKQAKLPDDMVTIKDKLTEKEASGWSYNIIESLQKGFNRVLTPDFITITDSEDLHGNDLSRYPSVKVRYIVRTYEEEFGPFRVPSVWTYVSTRNGVEQDNCFILGISMDFNADFNYPGLKSAYVVNASGDPGSERIEADKSVVYNRMCDRCVEKFTDKLESEFGIEGNGKAAKED